MQNRIRVQGTSVFIQLLHGNKTERIGLVLRWFEALDFAEELIEACDIARKNAEKLHCIPHERKNS